MSLLPGACSLSKWGGGPRVLAKIWHGGTLGTGVLEDSPRNQGSIGLWPFTGHVSPSTWKGSDSPNLLLPSASAPRVLLPPLYHSTAVASGTPTSLPPRSLFLICDSSSSHRPPKNPDLSTPPAKEDCLLSVLSQLAVALGWPLRVP